MKFTNWIKQNSLSLIISISLVVIFLAFVFFSEESFKGLNNLAYFFLYMGISIFSWTLPKNRIFNIIKIILAVPYLILMFLMPFFGFLYASIYGILGPLAAITIFIHYVPEYLFNVDLLFATKLYLVLTIWSIVVVSFSEKIMRRVILIQDNDKPNNRKEKQIDFTLSLINNGIIKYIIYLSFFISLVIFSFTRLNQIEIFDNNDLNTAIIQSFVTFIAFDRLIMNKQLFKFSRIEILKNLMNVWKTYT
ncbi:hypothetical protein GWK08_16820 [Leptobacterium flavescens]|uniref:Uncharacterized protein n=1 Tax=Leptobacterium flavescens TaxID=472055 RepID=A0A6P0URG3_9FLAO|nr:hypothetical protein [Leptobacterium flavescens]NER15120.1 hypothetical protein [Leptobacterium flavescens]